MKLIITLAVLFFATLYALIHVTDLQNNEVVDRDRSTYDIPDWVKHNANWWAEGHISDSEFSRTIEFLINEGVILVEVCEGKCLLED